MGFNNTLGIDPLDTVYPFIVAAVPLIYSITLETRIY